MTGHLSWKRLLAELVGVCAVALILSAFIGYAGFCLFVGLLLLLFWHFYHLIQLSHWLWSENMLLPPEARGSWFPIFYGIRKMRLHQRSQRKYLASILSYFRKGAEFLPDASILCQVDGHVLWCNRQAQFLLGLKWPQDKDQQILNLIRLPAFSVYLKNKNYEQPITLSLFTNQFLEFRITFPYIDNNLLIVVRDITETYSVETMRQHFFANVSHEIRVPLTVLQGYIEMLKGQKNLSALEQKAYMSMALQVSRLKDMSSQLTLLARIESSPITYAQKNIDMSKIIYSIVNDFQANPIKKQNILLNIDPKIIVVGNEEQLKQVVTNLFYNAVEHNEENCEINISWQVKQKVVGTIEQETLAIFSIKDNGTGIAKAHLERLTERFYRVDSARARETQSSGGTGLGLAIVKHALQNHHSMLEIESIEGKGCHFSFCLPIVKN